MKTAVDYLYEQLLNEAVIGKDVVKFLGIFKRVSGTFLGPLAIPETKINGKKCITVQCFNSKDRKNIVATIVLLPSSITQVTQKVNNVFVSTRSSNVIKACEKALSILGVENNKTAAMVNNQKVIVFGRELDDDQWQTNIQSILAKLNEQVLSEAVQSTISVATGSSSAMIRLRGGGAPEINNLVHTITNLRDVLFVQRVEDNGTSVKFTFGKIGRPQISLIVQRKNKGVFYGPRSFGYNTDQIVDKNNNKLNCAVALVQVNDRTGVYSYSGINTKLKFASRSQTKIRNNNVAGVPLNKQTLKDINSWLRKMSTMNTAIQIINSWNQLVRSVGE